MDRQPLEQQIFTWENWQDMGPSNLQFMDVELIAPVGDFPVGTKFPAAFFLGEASLLVLIDDKEEEHAFELKVTTGERVQPPVHSHEDSCGCGHEH